MRPDGLLNVQAIVRLANDDAALGAEDFVANDHVATRRQAVPEPNV